MSPSPPLSFTLPHAPPRVDSWGALCILRGVGVGRAGVFAAAPDVARALHPPRGVGHCARVASPAAPPVARAQHPPRGVGHCARVASPAGCGSLRARCLPRSTGRGARPASSAGCGWGVYVHRGLGDKYLLSESSMYSSSLRYWSPAILV